MKKVIILAVLVLTAIGIGACTRANDEVYSYVAVEINPAIIFIIDEDDIVVDVIFENEDAEIVAADLEFIGMNAEEALELFLEAAIETGYIDVNAEDNAVFITADEEQPELGNRMSERAKAYFHAHKIGAAIINQPIDEDLIAQAEELGIGVGRLRILQVAAELDDELTLEDLLDMEMRDVMNIITADHQERMQAFQQEKRQEALEMKNMMRQMVQDKVNQHFDELDDLPDVDMQDYRDAFMQRRDDLKDTYRDRMQDRRAQARDNMPD